MQINNPVFNVVESDHFKMQAGLPNFVLSAFEWIEKTNAIGITVRKGKYGVPSLANLSKMGSLPPH